MDYNSPYDRRVRYALSVDRRERPKHEASVEHSRTPSPAPDIGPAEARDAGADDWALDIYTIPCVEPL